MTDESEILAAMEAHAAARINGDVDAVLDSYSEDWEDSKGFRKSSLKEAPFENERDGSRRKPKGFPCKIKYNNNN